MAATAKPFLINNAPMPLGPLILCEEIAVSSDYRTIRIPLEEGDKWVEVIGTYVIPEFGSIVIIILVVAVSSAIIMSKSKFSIK